MQGRQPSNLVDAEILVGCKDAANELGIDVTPVLRDCGIDPELMLAPAGFIHHYPCRVASATRWVPCRAGF